MISPQALIRLIVARTLPPPNVDSQNNDVSQRGGRYGESGVLSFIRKQHLLADEGSYFLVNNNQTGIATPAVAAFGATTPLCIIQNQDTAGGKRIYLDYLKLVTTAAGSFASAGVNLQLMLVLDSTLRYTSGGTNLTPNIVSPNMDLGVRSIASVFFGAITAAAASGQARSLVGLDILRPVVSATVADVIGELKLLNFGGVEAALNGSITVANANQIGHPLPPAIIGPGHSALIYFVMNGTTPAAASYAPELAWFER